MVKLIITDKKQFDEDVWQTDADFTAEEYQTWLQQATDSIQRCKEQLEDEAGGDGDTYILGDIANLLSSTKVVLHEPHEDESLTRMDSASFKCILGEYDIEKVIDVIKADMEDRAWDYDVQDAYVEQDRDDSELRSLIRQRLAELI